MFKIKTLNKIAPVGLDLFENTKYIIDDKIDSPDAIVVRSTEMKDLAVPASLRAVARAGAGVNNIPVDAYAKAGIVVFNTPGANANAVRELAIAAILLASRDISGGIAWARGLKDSGVDVAKEVEKGKSAFVGPEITGKTVGVVGLGAIGGLTANAADALGMNVLGYDPYLSVDAAWSLSSSVKKAATLKPIYEKSDYIVLHAPVTDETKKMINADTIALMKNGVCIINLSRADLVDDDAMAAALESGRVARYVTDFPNEKVLAMKNAVPIPHLGASTPESEDNCAVMAVNELREFLESGNIRNSVNYPNIVAERVGDYRVCILHLNKPNMISQMSAAFGNKGTNIENLINKSRGDYAYTIMEIIGEIPEGVTESLKAIDGIIRVTIIK